MKKLSVLFLLVLLLFAQTPSNAELFAKQKERIQQNKIYKNTISDLKDIINKQNNFANQRNYDDLNKLYSKDFISSDGFDKEVYFKLIKETWETYPDITYKTKINNIEYTDNYATAFVTETAYATSNEEFGDFQTVGELYSTSNCVYHLEKRGNNWLVISEKIIDETSALKYGEARYINIELNAPKQIGANKYYTTTLKVDAPKDAHTVASISKENIVYPQVKSEDAFRRLANDNILERVFLANKENVNEYAIASVGITHIQDFDVNKVKVYMSGLAFVMTRVNIVPENKFIDREKVKDGENK